MRGKVQKCRNNSKCRNRIFLSFFVCFYFVNHCVIKSWSFIRLRSKKIFCTKFHFCEIFCNEDEAPNTFWKFYLEHYAKDILVLIAWSVITRAAQSKPQRKNVSIIFCEILLSKNNEKHCLLSERLITILKVAVTHTWGC